MHSARAQRVWYLLVLGVAALSAGAGPGDDPGKSGPGSRVPWTSSKVAGSPEPPTPYKAVRGFPKLEVKQPLALAPEPGTNRLFILQHLNYWAGPGRLLAAEDRQDVAEAETLLEIDGIAYGVAFHPKYEQNGYLYVGLNGPNQGSPKKTKVVRYTVDRGAPHKIIPDSALEIISWVSDGHNGGDLAFGPDGFLYISSGDGSSDSDRDLTGQTLDDLLAAVLRIDVDHPEGGKPYGIPKDNPFLDRPKACPEIWAYGFRNPWRLAYDLPSDQLWVGQNGQDLWEQVYLVKKGANYGWSVAEGSHTFHAKRQAGPDPISPPTAEHHHSEARSLTGGRVYRGPTQKELMGAYIYGDWSTGRVWGVLHDGQKVVWNRELVDTPFNITGFGTDHSGELYVIDQITGGFYRLEKTTPEDAPKHPFPTRLSETGLFASTRDLRPMPGPVPYQVVVTGWADGATAERYAAFPDPSKVEQKPQPNAGGSWSMPEGSVMVQTLTLTTLDDAGRPRPRRVETRLLHKEQREWTGYSYLWNDEQTDAALVRKEGDVAEFVVPDAAAPAGRREQLWRIPSRTECLVCHSRAAGFILGFSPLQLDREYTYNGATADQLDTLEALGVFQGDLPKRAEDRKRLADPYDEKADTLARVKSYLHVNCSTCHVEAGGGNARMELGYNTPLGNMKLVGAEPIHDRFDIADAQLVAPGSPERSILYQRLTRRGTGQMPPLGTTEVDAKAAALFADWIRGLEGVPPPVEMSRRRRR